MRENSKKSQSLNDAVTVVCTLKYLLLELLTHPNGHRNLSPSAPAATTALSPSTSFGPLFSLAIPMPFSAHLEGSGTLFGSLSEQVLTAQASMCLSLPNLLGKTSSGLSSPPCHLQGCGKSQDLARRWAEAIGMLLALHRRQKVP